MHQYNRKMFLRMVGGGLFSLPFLPSMVRPGSVLAQAPGEKLKRLILLQGNHSSNGSLLIPDLSKGGFGNGDPSFLAAHMAEGRRVGALPLDLRKAGGLFDIPALTTGPYAARLRQEMLVINGLVSPRQEYGHQRDYFGINADNRDPDKLGIGGKPTTSIDHIIADHLQPGSSPILLGISGSSIDLGGSKVGGKNLSEAFTTYFSSYTGYPAAAGAGAAVDPRKAMNASLLDLAKEQRAALAAHPRLSSADKTRLGSYFDAISDLEKRMATQRSFSAQCVKPAVGQPATRQLQWSGGTLEASTNIEGWVAYIKAALLCDISPVINIFGLTHDQVYFGGVNGTLANAFNAAGYISSDNGRKDDHAYWHDQGWDPRFKSFAMEEMKLVARIAQEIANLKDADGEEMLKSTLVMHYHEHAVGSTLHDDGNHQFVDYSYLLFGGSNALATGRMLDFMSGDRRPMNPTLGCPSVNQFLTTIMQGFGVPSTKWRVGGAPGYGPEWQRESVTRRILNQPRMNGTEVIGSANVSYKVADAAAKGETILPGVFK